MPFNAERPGSRLQCTGRKRASAALCVLLWCGVAGGCDSNDRPTAPDGGPRRYIGTWLGTIVSSDIGEGALRVVFQTQTDTPQSLIVSGVATRTFSETRFSGTVTVTAAVLPGHALGTTFGRGTVPCPGETGGESQRTLFATLAVAEDTMQGPYIAGGCPGGTIWLKKQ